MQIIVQKFGGTSVATPEKRKMVVEKIKQALSKGLKSVVVISAMGRSGDPYATDTLINLVKSINKNIPLRELDLIMSCGELISCVVMANTLIANGLKAKVLTGGQAGIITDNNFGNASVLRVEPKNILECLQNGIIPVVAGFQGITENGDITTLGRGGSDTTASIIGEAVKAELIEIYTDVDGIMTADPNMVPHAKIIDKMSYTEVFQLAEHGAKVIHPRAVEIAMRGNIPLVIKNTNNDLPGTYITNFNELQYSPTQSKLVTGVTYIYNRAQISIDMNEDENKDWIFEELAQNGISIDLINIFPDKKVFTVNESDLEKVEKILGKSDLNYKIIRGLSKVSIVGNRIHGVPGIMAKIIKALAKNNIKILQTSDSHATISCLIKGEDTQKAVIALHDEFIVKEA